MYLGHYGAFLMEEWELIQSIIRQLCSSVSVPVTAKIRVFETSEKTVEYAKLIQDAGATMLTVHGRLREQKVRIYFISEFV
jgi:tRNA-dihydrouridine synthase 1